MGSARRAGEAAFQDGDTGVGQRGGRATRRHGDIPGPPTRQPGSAPGRRSVAVSVVGASQRRRAAAALGGRLVVWASSPTPCVRRQGACHFQHNCPPAASPCVAPGNKSPPARSPLSLLSPLSPEPRAHCRLDCSSALPLPFALSRACVIPALPSPRRCSQT